MNRTEELTLLKEIAERLNEATEIEPMLTSVLKRLLKLTEFESAWIFFVEPDGTYRPIAATNVPDSLLHAPYNLLECGDCWCLNNFQNFRFERATNTLECRRSELARGLNIAAPTDFTHHATVPLQTRTERFGVLNVAIANRTSFTADELQLLTTIGYQISTALQRIRLSERTQQLLVLETRQHFAYTLHDSVKQLLFSAQLHTQTLGLSLNEEVNIRSVQTIHTLLQTISEELHALIYDTRPDALADGLFEAVKQYALLNRLRVTIHGSLTEKISSLIEEQLYRIIQEALNNVRKHAKTDKVTITFRDTKDYHVLEITDDGCGYNVVHTTKNSKQVGLSSIADRVRSIGGIFQLTSNYGQGTTLIIRWAKKGVLQ